MPAVAELSLRPPATPGRTSRVRRAAAWARTTPGRLTIIACVLVGLGVATGVQGWLDGRDRTAAVRDMAATTGPLDVSALELYHSLSDADAIAASEFLTGQGDSPALRDRYLADLAQAGELLLVVTRNAEGDSTSLRELVVLTAQIPVYSGLVETARANNRQGLPLGAAYLREASVLMREVLLLAARRLYDTEKERLARPRRPRRGRRPWCSPWPASPCSFCCGRRSWWPGGANGS